MGSEIKSWDTFIAAIGSEGGPSGAYYAGSEMLWLIVAIAICVVSLFIGCKHELDAYSKLKK